MRRGLDQRDRGRYGGRSRERGKKNEGEGDQTPNPASADQGGGGGHQPTTVVRTAVRSLCSDLTRMCDSDG